MAGLIPPMTLAKLKLLLNIRVLKAALWRYYSAPQLSLFFNLRNGFIYFAVGLVSVYMANINMPPSLTQECIVLAGILFCALGFFIAMKAYIRIVISRFVLFFSR